MSCTISRQAWGAPTTFDEACRRASGRRSYNNVRRTLAVLRRMKVAGLMLRLGAWHGSQAVIARSLRVSQATISRDVAGLRAEGRDFPRLGPTVCPLCRRPGWPKAAKERRLAEVGA